MIGDGHRLQLLRYPGSKGRKAGEIVPYFHDHQLYLEPFGGSYAIIGQKKRSYLEAVNDIDKGITALAYCYIFLPDELIRVGEMDMHVQSLWKYLKDNSNGDMLYQAIRKLYIISHSFGAKGDSFRFAVNQFRPSNIYIPRDRVMAVHSRLKYIQLFSEDCCKFIERFNKAKNTFIYLDPPYTVTEKGGHYEHVFTKDDHTRLFNTLDILDNNNFKWLMSYDKVSMIEKLYEKYYQKDIEFLYSVNKKKSTIDELLISNYKLEQSEQTSNIQKFFK